MLRLQVVLVAYQYFTFQCKEYKAVWKYLQIFVFQTSTTHSILLYYIIVVLGLTPAGKLPLDGAVDFLTKFWEHITKVHFVSHFFCVKSGNLPDV